MTMSQCVMIDTPARYSIMTGENKTFSLNM
jgi:hypothetical protein